MPVFLQGRRAFLSSLRRRHRRCNPLSVHRVTDSGLAYPRRAYSCRACHAAAAVCHSYSHLASHAAAACHSYPHLASPAATAARHSYPHFAYFAAAAFGYRGATRTATLPAWSEMPPRPVFLQLFYGTSHSRSPSLLCPGHKKGGRNRTEARPPPKSNQSVAAASPRQVFNPSGQCTRLKQTRSV